MENNELSKEREISIGGGISSLRRKYLNGKGNNINYGVVLKQKFENLKKPNKSLEIKEKILSIEELTKVKKTNIGDYHKNAISKRKTSEKKKKKKKKESQNLNKFQ